MPFNTVGGVDSWLRRTDPGIDCLRAGMGLFHHFDRYTFRSQILNKTFMGGRLQLDDDTICIV